MHLIKALRLFSAKHKNKITVVFLTETRTFGQTCSTSVSRVTCGVSAHEDVVNVSHYVVNYGFCNVKQSLV